MKIEYQKTLQPDTIKEFLQYKPQGLENVRYLNNNHKENNSVIVSRLAYDLQKIKDKQIKDLKNAFEYKGFKFLTHDFKGKLPHSFGFSENDWKNTQLWFSNPEQAHMTIDALLQNQDGYYADIDEGLVKQYLVHGHHVEKVKTDTVPNNGIGRFFGIETKDINIYKEIPQPVIVKGEIMFENLSGTVRPAPFIGVLKELNYDIKLIPTEKEVLEALEKMKKKISLKMNDSSSGFPIHIGAIAGAVSGR